MIPLRYLNKMRIWATYISIRNIRYSVYRLLDALVDWRIKQLKRRADDYRTD